MGHTTPFLVLSSALLYGWLRALLVHNNEWGNPCMHSSFHHTCNDPDGDKRNLPDADTHPVLYLDEDDDDNIALSSFVQFSSLFQSCSYHSSVFHFLALFVILLALANGRFSQSNPNHCCPFETSGNSIIESIHVVREKTLADSSQTCNLLFSVCHNLSFTNGCCRFVL